MEHANPFGDVFVLFIYCQGLLVTVHTHFNFLSIPRFINKSKPLSLRVASTQCILYPQSGWAALKSPNNFFSSSVSFFC